MHQKNNKKRLPRFVVALIGTALVITVLSLSRFLPTMLGYLSLYASTHHAPVLARGLASLSIELSCPREVVKLAIDSSFQIPAHAAIQQGDYDKAMEIVTAWQEYTQGRDALPYCWKAGILDRMGDIQNAGKTYLKALRVHDQYPVEQSIGFVTVLAAATNGLDDCESHCLSNIIGIVKEGGAKRSGP